MASPGNEHCSASCIGTLSFPIRDLFSVHSISTELNSSSRTQTRLIAALTGGTHVLRTDRALTALVSLQPIINAKYSSDADARDQ